MMGVTQLFLDFCPLESALFFDYNIFECRCNLHAGAGESYQ